MDENKPLLSIEGALGILAGLVAATADMGWELRTILLTFAIGLVVHIARRLNFSATRRFGTAVLVILGLILVTWRPIWEGFHKAFPEITGEGALSRIIVAAVVFLIGLAGYWFIIRPRGKGWRVIPAQLMAFGICVVGLGLAAAAIGLIWQFQQNRTIGIITPVEPALLPPPTPIPQIPPTQPPNALPPPSKPVPEQSTPFLNGYTLTPAGSRALENEAFKIKGILPNLTVNLQNNDNSGRTLAASIVRAFSIGGIPSTINFGQLGGPTEKG